MPNYSLLLTAYVRSYRSIAEQSFVTNTFALPHVVERDAGVHNPTDLHELST